MNNALKSIGFKKSAINECVWYRDNTIFLCYVGGSIFVGPDSKDVDAVIEEIRKTGLYIEDKGNIEDNLGFNI